MLQVQGKYSQNKTPMQTKKYISDFSFDFSSRLNKAKQNLPGSANCQLSRKKSDINVGWVMDMALS